MSTDVSQPLKESATPAKVELSKDKIFHLLRNKRRRAVISLLLEHDELSKRTLGELAAAREYNREVCDIPSKDRQTVKISLQQNHYDPLVDAGVITRDGSVFRANSRTELFRRYVDVEENPDVSADGNPDV